MQYERFVNQVAEELSPIFLSDLSKQVREIIMKLYLQEKIALAVDRGTFFEVLNRTQSETLNLRDFEEDLTDTLTASLIEDLLDRERAVD